MAVGTALFFQPYHKPAATTGYRVGVSHGSATGNAISHSQRVGRATELAGDACQPLGQFVGGPQVDHSLVDHPPGFLTKLDAFDILGDIVQPAEQTERVAQDRKCSMSQACSDSQPCLLADFHHHPILHGLDVDSQCGLPAGPGSHPGGDLDGYPVPGAKDLCMHIAAVEFAHECMSDVVGLDVSVKDSSVHNLDYNPLYKRRRFRRRIPCLMNIYAIKRLWFKTMVGALAAMSLGLGLLFLPDRAGAVQDASTPTGVFITVTYTDPINVRSGPSTVNYPIVGQLAPGSVAPALGVSPAREWIQISFPGTASGTGWVYSSFVSVSGGELRIVESPPTPTPPVTNTIDPTLAAAFDVQPTQTRMPTFTPPPPLTQPQFEDETSTGSSRVFGIFIVSLGLIGGLGLLVSFLWRK